MRKECQALIYSKEHTVQYRLATLDDLPTLTRLNQQLIEDEDHRNRFASYTALEKRMRGFLTGK